ncbi:MAG: Zn-dependent hydrolase [Chromatiales bacterium]|jgi:beta-ureidopropionase / N-carbamoyl-L-amino-acid hydrolase|nr:Zn-dependent hydrolase [Chromatiales bacterium]
MPINSRPNLSIDGDRLWSTLDRSAQIGVGKAGGLRRVALSDDDKVMRDQFVEWCQSAGCQVTVDAAGNIFARRSGREDTLPPVVVGSHLDTQAAGGRFDGILGVLAGLEILRTLADNKIVTRRPIEAVNWTNEEGARFAPPMAASCVFAGIQPLEWLHGLHDDDGIRLGNELERIGYLGEAPVGGRKLDSYFELHIEQDSLMESAGKSVGIVTGGYYSHALTCVFRGECAHTGPTEMKKRKNAMIGAAYFLAAVNDIGWAYEPVGRASASRMQIWPNKFGILPEFTEVTVDMRHKDRALTNEMVTQVRAALHDAARKANVEAEIAAEWTFGDEVFDPDCAQLVRDAATLRGVSQMDITSIAGHDAYYISRIAPTALVFSPCVDGITHNEAEDIRREPTEEAVNVFFDAVVARADR